jgi:hypothetical protein
MDEEIFWDFKVVGLRKIFHVKRSRWIRIGAPSSKCKSAHFHTAVEYLLAIVTSSSNLSPSVSRDKTRLLSRLYVGFYLPSSVPLSIRREGN